MKVYVGCCGFPMSRRRYYDTFDTVELQETFYNRPDPERMARLRGEAPESFVFNMKAWQAVTHPPSSPTWRRCRLKVPPELADRYGYLRPTEENLEAWERTLEICRALGATVCVLQTPASFKPTPENVSNAEAFFSTIRRDGVMIAWEPRGAWHDHPELIKKICDAHDVIHVVDLLRRRPVSSHPVAYVRLHGLGPGEVNYRYKYTDEDLRRLLDLVLELAREKEAVYVLFNNVHMRDDAKRFLSLLRQATQSE